MSRQQVQGLIAKARLRLRLQRIFEGLTTGFIVSVMVAMVAVVFFKTGWMGAGLLGHVLLSTLVFPALGVAWAFMLKIDSREVALKIDHANGLKARLTTALCFLETPQAERTPFMKAAIEECLPHLEAAKVGGATPFALPAGALTLALVFVAFVGLSLLRTPAVTGTLATPEDPPPPEQVFNDDDLNLEREKWEATKKDLLANDDPDARVLTEDMDRLFEQLEKRELNKEQFMEKADDIKKKFFDDKNKEWKNLLEALAKVEDQLKDDPLTKDLAEALKKGDMDKAADELDKIAKKIENGELSDKQLEKLAKKAEKLAKKFDKDSKKLDELLKKKEKELSRLKKKLEEKKKSLSKADKRRLSRLGRDLKKLRRQRDHSAKSGKTKSLKKLSNAMRKGSKGMRRAKKRGKGAAKGKAGKAAAKNDVKQGMKAASGELREAGKKAKTGKAKEKAGKQLADMREKLKRAQGGDKGKEKAKAAKDFNKRAQANRKGGGKAQKGAKEGKLGGDLSGDKKAKRAKGDSAAKGKNSKEVDKKDKGKFKANGQGKGQGDRKLGEATEIADKTLKDTVVKGKEGDGPTTSEVISSAAQQGFAGREYQDVYAEYEKVVEEVLETEKVPPGYRFYVHRYFELIRPRNEP